MKEPKRCAICEAKLKGRTSPLCVVCERRVEWYLKYKYNILYLLEDKKDRWH